MNRAERDRGLHVRDVITEKLLFPCEGLCHPHRTTEAGTWPPATPGNSDRDLLRALGLRP